MQEICWNTEVFPNEIFRYCVTKSFRRRNLIPPLWCIKSFATRNFLIHRSVPPTKLFGTVWQIFFDGKSWYSPSPSYPKTFLLPDIFWNTYQKGSSTKFFGTETKNFRQNRDKPPLIHKFYSIPENFRKTEGFLHESFRSCEMKNFDKTVKLPLPSFAWNFSIPEFFRNTEGFSYEIYRHCETKIFQRSLVISPSYA